MCIIIIIIKSLKENIKTNQQHTGNGQTDKRWLRYRHSHIYIPTYRGLQQ